MQALSVIDASLPLYFKQNSFNDLRQCHRTCHILVAVAVCLCMCMYVYIYNI